jgi:hypothetical protein
MRIALIGYLCERRALGSDWRLSAIGRFRCWGSVNVARLVRDTLLPLKHDWSAKAGEYCILLAEHGLAGFQRPTVESP